MPYRPRVHIRDTQFPSRSICGRHWHESRGGRVASDTEPPIVKDEETGSVNPATCRKCVQLHREALLKKSG